MRRQIIIGSAVTVLVLILLWVFLIAPVGSSISAAQKSLDAARAQEQTLQQQLAQLQQSERNSTDIDARLAKFELLLPKSPDLPTFIRQLQLASDASKIDLLSLAPSPPIPLSAATSDPALTGKGIYTIGVSLSIEGGFFRIQSFIQRLEDLQRVVQVTSVSLAPAPGSASGPGTLSANLSLTLYVLNPNLPLPGSTPSPTPSAGGSGPATPSPASTVH